MVGIVIVSHSQKLAEGVVEVAQMMAADAPVAAAGGLDGGNFVNQNFGATSSLYMLQAALSVLQRA